jgi:phage shock protein PspC (stress-responsive transcriptional regulator)
MSLLLLAYILVPIAIVVMFKNYKKSNWAWLGILIVSIFLGIAPYVAAAYLATYLFTNKKSKSNSGVTYSPDGSYTVYNPTDTKSAPSTGKTAFKIIGGILAGLAVTFGLLIVGVIILIATYKPPAGSKGM